MASHASLHVPEGIMRVRGRCGEILLHRCEHPFDFPMRATLGEIPLPATDLGLSPSTPPDAYVEVKVADSGGQFPDRSLHVWESKSRFRACKTPEEMCCSGVANAVKVCKVAAHPSLLKESRVTDGVSSAGGVTGFQGGNWTGSQENFKGGDCKQTPLFLVPEYVEEVGAINRAGIKEESLLKETRWANFQSDTSDSGDAEGEQVAPVSESDGTPPQHTADAGFSLKANHGGGLEPAGALFELDSQEGGDQGLLQVDGDARCEQDLDGTEALEILLEGSYLERMMERPEGCDSIELCHDWLDVPPQQEARLPDNQPVWQVGGSATAVPQQVLSNATALQSASQVPGQKVNTIPTVELDQGAESVNIRQIGEERYGHGPWEWTSRAEPSGQEEARINELREDFESFVHPSVDAPGKWEATDVGMGDLHRPRRCKEEREIFIGNIFWDGGLAMERPPATASNSGKAAQVDFSESLDKELESIEALSKTYVAMEKETDSPSNTAGGVYEQSQQKSATLQGGFQCFPVEPLIGISSQMAPSAGVSQTHTEAARENLSRARSPVAEKLREGTSYRLAPDVGIVVIDDDDEDDDDDEYNYYQEDEEEDGDAGDSDDDTDSDAGSMRPVPMGAAEPGIPPARKSSDASTESSSSEEDSDDDDCQVLGWRPAQRNQPLAQRQGTRRPSVRVEEEQYANACGQKNTQHAQRENDSSDIEVMGGSQGDIRRQWEDAALRRRMGRAMQSENSKASRDGGRGQPSNLGKGNASQGARGNEPAAPWSSQRDRETAQWGPTSSQGLAESVATSTDSEGPATGRGDTGREATAYARASKEQGAGVGSSFARGNQSPNVSLSTPKVFSENPAELLKVFVDRMSGVAEVAMGTEKRVGPERPHAWMANQAKGRDFFHNVEKASTSKADEFQGAADSRVQNPEEVGDPNAREGAGFEAVTEVVAGQNLLGEREKMKQTAEFQQADEEEWARRQLELQRQAQEVQRLRKRKRAEADRKMEMESRQKQRLEEIRQSQKKEEWNMGLKEEVRGQVRTELERLASGCIDMASLLRRLGISVEGGAYPTVQQVNAAYKRALLRFHPDRASALAQGDPRRQVEAEETFKLISRMKNSLNLVASPLFNPFQ